MVDTERTADAPEAAGGDAGTALVWRIKASLLAYVWGEADGEVLVDDGAVETDDGFAFPLVETVDGTRRFGGCVTLRGHSGMMLVELAEPSLVPSGDGWRVELADPDAPSARLRFADVAAVRIDGDGTERGSGTTLTADGAGLFFGPYEEGTPLDDPAVVVAGGR